MQELWASRDESFREEFHRKKGVHGEGMQMRLEMGWNE
jgi:hypothetical protein